MTTLRCAAMTEARARATAGWSYGAPYDIYDHPSWERMKEERWGLTDPAVRELEFVALLDDDDALAGFLRFMPRGLHPSVGLGLRPDLCGRGLGARALEQLEQEAVRRWGSVTLELSVRTFNERAIRCYESGGWTHIGTLQEVTRLGPGEFAVMQRALGPLDAAEPAHP